MKGRAQSHRRHGRLVLVNMSGIQLCRERVKVLSPPLDGIHKSIHGRTFDSDSASQSFWPGGEARAQQQRSVRSSGQAHPL